MTDEPLAYLAELRKFNRSWRRWRNPARVLLWAIRTRFPTKPTTITIPWFNGDLQVSQSRGAFYADRRDFKEARTPKQLALVTECYLRGHDMPIQVCLRCGAFLP